MSEGGEGRGRGIYYEMHDVRTQGPSSERNRPAQHP